MRADQVEVSWDAGKSKWLVRIVNDEQALGAAALKTVQDEGYEADAAQVSVRR